MLLTNEWYFYTSSIDKKTCNKIKALGKDDFNPAQIDKNEGTTAEERITGRKTEHGLDKKKRISDASWTKEQWVIDLVWSYMLHANENAGWNFDITAVETMQITKYKPGSFYGWHKDGPSDSLSAYNLPDNKFLHGNVRKLSMTILLNGNYQGGEFQFSNSNKLKHKIETPDFKNAGSIIVFPSFMEHQVAPVTKGTRYSLVAWFVGPPFK
jgi:PKHD-type hydroxylase